MHFIQSLVVMLHQVTLVVVILFYVGVRSADGTCSNERKVFRNVTSGNLSDGLLSYKSNERCEWLIESPDPPNMRFITLTFQHKDTECVYDYLTVYDGDSYNSKVLATISGDATNTRLPRLIAKSGFMLVYFFSDSNYERDGFEAFFEISACPNHCSGNGRCSNSICQCYPRWIGEDCSMPACPYDCSDHGECRTQSDKSCLCWDNYIGIGCGMHDSGVNQANTWMTVHKQTSDDNLSTGRVGHVAVYTNSYLWVFGGYDLNRAIANFMKYDFSNNTWVTLDHEIAPEPRRFHTMNVITHEAKSYLLLFGGELSNQKFTNELWLYNTLSDSWHHSGSPAPASLHPVAQHASSIVTTSTEQYLYVFGGRFHRDGYHFSSDMHRFNWRTQTWEQVVADLAGLKPSAIKVAGHSMVYDEVSKLLVVFGGFTLSQSRSDRSNSLYLFSVERNFWYMPTVTESLPAARAFHTANIVGDYMVIYGGNTHTHKTDESCHSNGTFFYNLRCHSWHEQPVSSEINSGRFGHASATMGKNLLLVHGGYDGTVRSELLVYKVPVYAIRQFSLSVSKLCSIHDQKAECLTNQKCSWCPLRTGGFCDSKQDISETCSVAAIQPSCKGLCEKLEQCVACTVFDRYDMNSSYDWQAKPCAWCVQDSKCYPQEEPASSGLCSNGMTSTGYAWWDIDKSVMANTTNLCLTKNIPLGFMAASYDKQNFNVPISAHFVRDDLKIEKKQNANQGAVRVAKGFVHVPGADKSPGDLHFWLIVKQGAGEFYLSTDDFPANAELIVAVNATSSYEIAKSELVARESGKRYLYKVLFYSNNEAGEIKVYWSVRSPDRSKEYHRIRFDYLEPYHSALGDSTCSSYTSCYQCLTDLACAWCSGLARCLPRSDISDYSETCRDSSRGNQLGVAPYFGIVTETSSCSSCSDYHSCAECVGNSRCGWSIRRGCVYRELQDGVVIFAQMCPKPCSLRTTCRECLQNDGSSRHYQSCTWCATTQRCYGFFHHLPFNSLGQCTLWLEKASDCLSCDSFRSCNDCLHNFQCGWCSNASNALIGACMSGGFDVPDQPDQCSNSGQVQWSYDTCPAVNECEADLPVNHTLRACHPNATCIDTRFFYDCMCDLGFSGDGFACDRVCARQCIHGKCSASPDYQCVCDLGWTSDPNLPDNCSVDCQCHFQSTCSSGSGKCDGCQGNAIGTHCEACASGFYRVNTNKTVCLPCQCNGHGNASDHLCSATTGVCSCLHDTTGDHCDICRPGFYGDPRHDGQCYRQCEGRMFFPASSITGAFGAWDDSGHTNGMFCMWVVSTKSGYNIKLTSDVALNCEDDHVFVYDGIPTSPDASVRQLAALCGFQSETVTLCAKSGVLTVMFETSREQRQRTSALGFNATYTLVRDTANRTDLSSGCDTTTSFSHTLCPNNCTSALHGLCSNGICHCWTNHTGVDCSISATRLNKPSHWNLEWDPTLRSMLHDFPAPSSGHCMLSMGDSLWVFGGLTNDGPTDDMYRYNLDAKRWSVLSLKTIPTPRYLHTCVAVKSERTMLVFGGLTDHGASQELWRFEFDADRWSLLSYSKGPPALAGHSFTSCHDSSFLLVGGYSTEHGLNDKVWAFYSRNASWEILTNHGSPFHGVFGHSGTYDQQTGNLYVFGGVGYSGNDVVVSSRVHVFNVAHRRWGEVTASNKYPPVLLSPPRYFHTAFLHNDGMHRGFLVVGGRTSSHDVADDVWLFRFDCHVWSYMGASTSESDATGKLYTAKLGYMMAGASTKDTSSSSAYYLYGGNRNGVLLEKLTVLRVSSPCYAASTECECELLRAGCLICTADNYNKSNAVRTACLPGPDPDLELSQCARLTNDPSDTAKPIVTSLCSATSQSSKRCATEFPASRAAHCSTIGNCLACVARVPHSSAPYCKWCKSKCTTDHRGSCLEADESCDDSCKSSPCSDCSAVTCQNCVNSLTNCTWQQSLSAMTSQYSHVWQCRSANSKEPVTPAAVPITMHKARQTCPANCLSHTSCRACLSSRGGWEAGAAACVWSTALRACFGPLHARLRCVGGACGFVVSPPASSCPVEDCSNMTYCGTCLKHRECGWIGATDGSGRGECRRGVYQGPENTDDVVGVLHASWHYMSCPAENECVNGHHHCSKLAPSFDQCQDTEVGYECVCVDGYRRELPGSRCTPVCEQACVHGECVKPNQCECSFGYTGSNCSTACECNGLSACPSLEEKHVCLHCMNNTRGSHCESCDAGFVGDPTLSRQAGEEPCKPCSRICNGKSSVCRNKSLDRHLAGKNADDWTLVPGPKNERDAVCDNCTGHSQGDKCDKCLDGYFKLRGICRKCECNGHGTRCDPETGSQCNCQNATESSDPKCTGASLALETGTDCWIHQCDKCKEGYKGTPVNGGQCFRVVRPSQEWCFDPRQQSGCNYDSNDEPQQLAANRTVLFALRPRYTNVDIRVFIDVTVGEVDVFVSTSDSSFDVRVDPRTGEHVVKVNLDSLHDDVQAKQSMTTISADSDDTHMETTRVTRSRQVGASKRNDYVVLDASEALAVTGVRNRLVLTSPHGGQDLRYTFLYVILVARTATSQLTSSSGNVTSDGSRARRALPQTYAVAAKGRLFFRQDQTRIDLFVFFSVFFSCFFLFLSLCIVAWKVKQVADRQQARIARDIQLQNMASRPFACAYVHLERRAPRSAKRDPFVLTKTVSAVSGLSVDAPCTPLNLWDELKANQKKQRHNTDSSSPRPAKNYFPTPLSRIGTISGGILANATDASQSNNATSFLHPQHSTSRHGNGAKTDLSQAPEGSCPEPNDMRRHSDYIHQKPAWTDGEIQKKDLIVHCPSEALEHRVPLLHTAQAYLTVTSEPDEKCRITPEYDVIDRTASPAPSKRASYPSKTTRKSLFVRFQQDEDAAEEETNFGTPDPLMLRSVSSPALAKPAKTASVTSKARGTSSRFSVGRGAKLGKFRLHRKRACPVSVGPVAFEPTESLQAGVATVVLQLPSTGNVPYTLCLGSALVSSKNMNLPSSSDANSSKSKYRLPLRKLL